MKTKLRLAALLTVLLGLLGGCAEVAPPETADSGTELRVYCFSAGKADAFLLYTENSAVLIDCGESGFGKTILAYMTEHGIEKLDALIITHFDKDHVGGAKKILESVSVDAVLQSNCPKDASAYNKYVEALAALGKEAVTVREELTFTLDGVRYTVNPPAQTRYAEDASNNSSLIVSVENGANRLLFAGDAQDARLTEFLAENPGSYDFLKVPYHGHWQDTLPAFFKAIAPKIAVITSSESEPEDEATLDLLAQYRARVYLTRNGPILIESNGTQLEVAD